MVNFGRVTEQAYRILIVATGPSLLGFDFWKLKHLPNVHVIAVKQAILEVQADSWVTVDPNIRSRRLMQNPRPGTKYIAAVPLDYGTVRPRVVAHHGPTEEHVLYLYRRTGEGPISSCETLSEDPTMLHTGNSAWGALGLAYLMRPAKIGFLGLDGTQEAHGIGIGAPRGSLSHLPWLFATASGQLVRRKIEVRNGNPNSLVDCFPRITSEDLLEWIAR